MRNPNRTAGPIRRTIVAPNVEAQPVSRNLLLRTQTVTTPMLAVRNRKAVSLSGAQNNDWARTPYLNPFTTPMTRAWDHTYRSHP